MWAFELYGYLLSNAATGLPLRFYWALSGKDTESNDHLLLDFIELDGVESVDDLDGLDEDIDVEEYDVAYASLIRFGHRYARFFSWEMSRLEPGHFHARVVLRRIADMPDDAFIEAEGEARFTKLIVRPEADPSVTDVDAARALLARFVDVSGLEAKAGEKYVFVPAE